MPERDWQCVIDKLLPRHYQDGAAKLRLFLESTEGLTAMNLLAATNKEIVILRNGSDPFHNDPTFILSGSGLSKICYTAPSNTFSSHQPTSATEIFDTALRKSDRWLFPGFEDVVLWLREQLDAIVKNMMPKPKPGTEPEPEPEHKE